MHHLQVKITELSRDVDSLREEKTQYQNKAAELVSKICFVLLDFLQHQHKIGCKGLRYILGKC